MSTGQCLRLQRLLLDVTATTDNSSPPPEGTPTYFFSLPLRLPWLCSRLSYFPIIYLINFHSLDRCRACDYLTVFVVTVRSVNSFCFPIYSRPLCSNLWVSVRLVFPLPLKSSTNVSVLTLIFWDTFSNQYSGISSSFSILENSPLREFVSFLLKTLFPYNHTKNPF